MSDYPPGMTLRPIERWPFEFTRNQWDRVEAAAEVLRAAGRL